MMITSKCKRKSECFYAIQDECGKNRKLCGYMLITGEPRGCPPDQCNKFLPRKESTTNGHTYKKADR